MRKRLLVAAWIACLVPAASAADLRTLFHSAEERGQLDRMRRGDPPEAAVAAKRGPPVVGGFVKRSDGRDTVWLDGVPVTGKEARRLADPASVRDGARAPSAPAIEIKPSR